MARFEDAIQAVLDHEGGFVDDPRDPGGATNFGISLRFLAGLADGHGDIDRDGDVDAEDVRALTRAQASDLYRARVWDAQRYGEIEDQDVAGKLFDMAVNMGPRQAHKLLQDCLRRFGFALARDGVFGPRSLGAVNAADPAALLPCLRGACKHFYLDLIARRPGLARFEKGWLRRAAS